MLKNDRTYVSIKAFLFNYEKQIIDNYKIPFILSEKACKQRFGVIKFELNVWKNEYYNTKNLLNYHRDREDKCDQILLNLCSEFNDPEIVKFMNLNKSLNQKNEVKHTIKMD